ncbi:MAG: hypothetical protein ABI783_04930 [Actinomycetota bacterium]
MSVTLTPPIRVAALVGVLVAMGLAAFVFLAARGATESDASAPTTPLTRPAAQTTTPPKAAHKAPQGKSQVVATRSGFPAPVDHALRYRRVVVVVVYMPGAAVDAVVRREARAAAMSSRAGYVAISALNERLAGSLVAKIGFLTDPAVVIVKRPGVVASRLSVTDRETIVQAVAQAKR